MADARTSPCPSLSPYVARALEALRADGIQPTDAEVGWLIRLRDACERPCTDGLRPLLGGPVQIAGEVFWPLHSRATRWFLAAGELCGDAWRTDVFLYAHVYSAPGDRTLELQQQPDAIKAAVGEWRQQLPLHDENVPELVRLLRLIDGDSDSVPPAPGDKDADQPPASPMAGVGMLCKLFPGTTPEYWQSGISQAEVDELMRCQQSGAWATSAQRTEAIAAFLKAVKWIRWEHGQHS